MSKGLWTSVEVIARLILGLVFGWAGWIKLHDPQALADSIYSFAVLPAALINPLALALPVLELVTGLLLLLGVRRRACAGLAAVMSVVFALALAQALLRGLTVDCGCFGEGAPSAAKNLLALVRDVALAGLAVLVMRQASRASEKMNQD